MTYKLASFFAGVGGIDVGFESGGDFEVTYANEFDKKAQTTYATNFGEDVLECGDIRQIDPNYGQFAEASVDVLSAGYPCQPFSIAGYRKGLADPRGDLFFEALRMIKAKQPQVVFLENVKNLVTHDHGNSFKVMREFLVHTGYFIKWRVLNATEYGNIRQNRERIYVVGFKDYAAYQAFEFPKALPLTNRLDEVIDFDTQMPDKYYYTPACSFYNELRQGITSCDTVYQWRRTYVRENKSGVSPTLTASMGTGGHNVPLILTHDNQIRKLTPRECFNLQGYPATYELPETMADSSLYKQAGNSVVVPVIARLAHQIEEALSFAKTNNDLPQVDNKVALVRVDMMGRLAGASEVVDYYDDVDALQAHLPSDLPLITDDEFYQLVAKGKSTSFYMIVG